MLSRMRKAIWAIVLCLGLLAVLTPVAIACVTGQITLINGEFPGGG